MIQRRGFVVLLPAALFGQSSKARAVILIGAPGSGKSTIAKMMAAEYGLPVIDAAAVAEANKATLAKRRTPGLASMDLVEDPGMNALIRAEIEKTDASKGMILDGYPATKFQADFLAELGKEGRLPRPLVLQLDVPDDVIRQRLGSSISKEAIEQRIKDYRRELQNAALYYPDSRVVKIDSNRKPEETFKDVKAAMQKE